MSLLDKIKKTINKKAPERKRRPLKEQKEREEAVLAGAVPATPTPQIRILFVCTANVCRSAMAESILAKKLASEDSLSETIIESAGIEALVSMQPDQQTLSVCDSRDVHITSHRAQQVTEMMLHEATYVICLAEEHKKLIASATPEVRERTFVLKEFLNPHPPKVLSVADPTGQSRKAYEDCFTEIETEIDRIVPQLRKVAKRLKSESEPAGPDSRQQSLW